MVRALIARVIVQEEELIAFSNQIIKQSEAPRIAGRTRHLRRSESLRIDTFSKPTTQSFSPISFSSPPPGNGQSHA